MKKILIATLIMVLISGIGLSVFIYLEFGTKKKVSEAKVVDSIKGYEYKLSDKDTEIYRENFLELKKVLEKDELDEEKYVTLISKLFIIDFFTLDNKVTNKDIGGVEFVHKDAKENFILKAKDTLYKYIESNIYGDRKQDLPEVSRIDNVKVETMKVNYKDINDEKAYKVVVNFSYKKDLGYTKQKLMIFVHEDKVLSLIEMK